jgi:ubiquinone biosynthesis protein
MAASPKVIPLPVDHELPRQPEHRFRVRTRVENRLPSKNGWSLNRPVKGAVFRTLLRFIEVLAVISYFRIRALLERLRTRNQRLLILRRAQLLRRVFEVLGGAFIKVGQQLSLRRDMLPAEYCEALNSLLDNVKEFPFKEAETAIQDQLGAGRPIHKVFRNLNPEPIGKASIACVYEAWLRDEHECEPVRVAIKVRRPGIVKLFASDLRALDWCLSILEYLTVVRSGVSRTFRTQLREILFDELDFRIEARFQELFRRRYKKLKKYRITAPKLYHRYCGQSVMVSAYVDAIPLNSVTSAVEDGDVEYLAYLDSLHIHPVRLAKRLVRYNFHAFFEDVFFHGDPHPGNIFVMPHNRLVLIDFGACGTFSKRDRNMMWEMHRFHARQDIRGMVECVIALMEPLPPVEIDEFRRALEKQYWDGYYGLLSKHADWRDRTSYRLWVALYDLVRQYQIPIPLNMLRMIRATLLYDTIAAQLHNDINVFKEFRKYELSVERRMKVGFFRDATRQAICGPDLEWYQTFRRLYDIGRAAIFRVQKFLEEPAFDFAAIADKVYYFLGFLARWLVSASGFALTVVLFLWARYSIGLLKVTGNVGTPEAAKAATQVNDKVEFWGTFGYFLVPTHWAEFWEQAHYTMTLFFIVLAVISYCHLRALSLRLSDPDVKRRDD